MKEIKIVNLDANRVKNAMVVDYLKENQPVVEVMMRTEKDLVIIEPVCNMISLIEVGIVPPLEEWNVKQGTLLFETEDGRKAWFMVCDRFYSVKRFRAKRMCA